MMEGWIEKTWNEILEIRSGRNQKEVEEPNGQYPILGSAGKVMGYANDFICEEGTTIIGRKGTINNPMLIKEKFWNVDTAFGLHAKDELDKRFLHYFCLGFDFTEMDRGSGRPSLVKSDLLKIKMFVPPLHEQKRIVSLLDRAFAAIDQAKANYERCLSLSKGLFESYLQGVFENQGEGWEEKILKDVCDLKSGTTISKDLEKTEGDVLYVKVGDMNLSENEVSINTSSRFALRAEIKLNQIIPEGSVIFPKRGGAIATNKKRKIVKPTIVDLNTMAIMPTNKIDKDFFFHWFRQIDLNTLSNGTSIPQINNYSFDEVKIRYPKSIDEQLTIVQQLNTLQAETQKLETLYQKKIAALDELKKSILQKAMTGEFVESQGELRSGEPAESETEKAIGINER